MREKLQDRSPSPRERLRSTLVGVASREHLTGKNLCLPSSDTVLHIRPNAPFIPPVSEEALPRFRLAAECIAREKFAGTRS